MARTGRVTPPTGAAGHSRGEKMPQSRTEQLATDAELSTSDRQVAEEDTLLSEMLVEEVSIDGMCGVY